MSDDTTAQHRETIRRLAAEAFKDHVIDDLGATERGGVHAYHFAQPGSGIYAVHVIMWPGWVVVAGDTGDTLFRHSDRDTIGWLRGAVNDVGYMLGKVQGARKVFMAGDALAYVEDRIAQLEHGRPGSTENSRILRELVECDDITASDFYQACSESHDDDWPACTDFDSDHLWAVEALRHFVAKLGGAGTAT